MSKDEISLPAWQAITRNIAVRVAPEYLPDQSDPAVPRHVWAYHVEIENCGAETVRLMTRRWKIVDATGHVEQVAGEGVVGQSPVLRPGEVFRYTSGAPLRTTSGFMSGHYGMVVMADAGASAMLDRFEAEIPAFSLDLPDASGRILN